MAVSSQLLVRDASTLANYKAWAMAISAFFTTAGWVQASDTGQVNWGTIATAPNNSIVRDYEIWKPGDGLQVFYVKVQYGTSSGSSGTSPAIGVSIGTATNGAGVLTGIFTPVMIIPNNSVGVTSTSIQYNCHFAGDTGRIGIMMWRDNTPVIFVIQRSLSNTGVAYGTSTTGYVTVVCIGADNNNNCAQYSVVFNAGVNGQNLNVGSASLFAICKFSGSGLFNGSIAMSPIFPLVGYFDNPMDAAAIGSMNDFSEGAQYNIIAANMPYGISHNYIASKLFTNFVGNVSASCFLMRYD